MITPLTSSRHVTRQRGKHAGRGTYPVFSGDGSRIFFQRRVERTPGMYQIWTTSPEGQDETLVGDIGPLVPDDATFDVSLQDRFVWVEYRQGRHELWLAELR